MILMPYLSAYMGHVQLHSTMYYIHFQNAFEIINCLIGRSLVHCFRGCHMRNSEESRLFYTMIRNYLIDFLPNTRNLSPCTIQVSKNSLNLLLDYCTTVKKIPLLKIDLAVAGNADLIKNFLSWLKDDRNCRNATLNQRLSCLRSFFRFVAYEDVSYVSIYQSLTTIARQKVPKNRTINFMSEDALKAILSEPDLNTRTGLRDAFYMALMYDSATRNSEMVAIKLRDIIDGKAPYVLVNGKGRKRRSIPLMSRTINICQLYMKKFHLNGQPNDHLFYTVHHGDHFPMSVDNVAKFVSPYAESAREHCDDVPFMFIHTCFVEAMRCTFIVMGCRWRCLQISLTTKTRKPH